MKRLFSILIPHRISWQVGLVFGLLIIISLGFLGLSLITTSRQAVADSVLRDYEDIAHRAAQELTGLTDRPRDVLINTAAILANIPPQDSELRKAILYRLFTDHAAQFEHIALTDAAGLETLTSDWSQPLKNRAAEPAAKSALTSAQPAYSGVYFSEEHVPYFDIAVPIKTLDTLSGLLIGRVKLSGFWNMVDSIKLQGGEAFIVDESGYVLVHKEERRVYRAENLAYAAPVREVLKGSQGSMEDSILSAAPGEKFLCAYAPIKPFGWGLIVRQPIQTAYSFSYHMQKTALMTIAIAIIIAIIISLFLAHWIIQPVKQLVKATEQVALGNLEDHIKTQRTDEMGGLLSAFNEMLKKLRQARRLERLSNIGLATSKISHELRNPLVAIKTFIQLLPRRQADQSFFKQFNELVPSELTRLEKMMQDLTDFSAVPKLRIGECRPDKLITQVLELFNEQLKKQNIDAAINSNLNGALIMADPDRLKQVLINLVNNAINAMPSGGKLYAQARPDADNKTVTIEIKDTGCGIPPEELAVIFEPFRSSRRGGLGLGLTICKEIIEQHRGTIEVQSRLNQGRASDGLPSGTSVTISLPAKGADNA